MLFLRNFHRNNFFIAYFEFLWHYGTNLTFKIGTKIQIQNELEEKNKKSGPSGIFFIYQILNGMYLNKRALRKNLLCKQTLNRFTY